MKKYIFLLLILGFPILLFSQTKIVYGLVDKNGEEKLPTQYDYLSYGGIYLGGKYALLDSTGNVLIWGTLNDKESIFIWQGDYEIKCFAGEYFKVYKAFYTEQDDLKEIKCGVINREGKVIIPFEYDNVLFISNIYYRGFIVYKDIWKDEKCGFINTEGEQVIPVEYALIKRTQNDSPFLIVSKNVKKTGKDTYERLQGLFSSTGKEVLPTEYTSIDVGSAFADDSWAISSEKPWPDKSPGLGFWDKTGKELSPPIYESLSIPPGSPQNFYGEIKKDGKWALINYKREILTPFIYDDIRMSIKVFNEKDKELFPIIIAQRDSVYCLLSKTGEELLTTSYLYNDFEYLYAGIQNNRQILYNYHGQPLGKEEAYLVRPKRDIVVDENELRGAFNPEGNPVIPYMYKVLDRFNGNYAAASLKRKYGVIDIDNNIVIPFKYDFAKVIGKDRCILGKRNILGVVKEVYFTDMQGKPVDNNKYDNFEEASIKYSLYAVLKGKKMGMCDADGVPFLACEYDGIYSGCMTFKDGKLLLEKNKKIGIYDFINRKHLTAIEYDAIDCQGEFPDITPSGDPLYTDFCLVATKGNLKCLLSADFKEISPCIYQEIEYFKSYRSDEKLLITTRDGKLGLMNFKAEEISPCIYQELKNMNDGMILAKKEGKYGVIDAKGAVLVPFGYDLIKPYGNNSGLYIVAKVI